MGPAETGHVSEIRIMGRTLDNRGSAKPRLIRLFEFRIMRREILDNLLFGIRVRRWHPVVKLRGVRL